MKKHFAAAHGGGEVSSGSHRSRRTRMQFARQLFAGAALALAGAATLAADQAPKPDKIVERNEARLAEMLKGRTAGEPVNCIPMVRSNRLEVIEGVALAYDAGDTIYVARPTDPDMLKRDDVMVIERTSSQLCNTDVVRTIDRSGGYMTGVIFLKKFVPYKKQD
jgi:hypothetical protein